MLFCCLLRCFPEGDFSCSAPALLLLCFAISGVVEAANAKMQVLATKKGKRPTGAPKRQQSERKYIINLMAKFGWTFCRF